MLLTKSLFMRYLEGPIRLWLEAVRPDLKPPEDPGLQRIFEQGHIIDDLARGLFPGGVEVKDYNEKGFKNTQKAMADGATILYQPTALAQNMSARGDILTKSGEGKWDIHEVKSSTQVKEEHIPDLAFQRTCFEAAGIPIGKTFIVHVNNEYVRHGEIDVEELMVEEDITEDVNLMLPEIQPLIPKAMEVLCWPRELAPEHLATCTDPTKTDEVLYWLNNLKPKARETVLRAMNPFKMPKLMDKKISTSGLSPAFLSEIGYQKPEERWPLRIDRAAIKEQLDALEYPLYFYDYETFSSAVPAFDGCRPYQQIPFQFSLSVVDAPGAKPQVHDFLMQTFEDPTPHVIAALREWIGPKGTVVTWNAVFEKGRNQDLAAMYPEHAEFLLDLNERTYDLMLVFKKKLYVHPDFMESASLKRVMPVLIPSLSYKALNIQEGGEASASWLPITDPKLPKEQREQLIKDEIEYCRLDVLAMVKIMEHLQQI